MGVDCINGVNLSGPSVIESFIVLQLFEHNPGKVDEWTLSVTLGSNLQQAVEGHYNTFVTEEDIVLIAGARLNWVRVPIPFWATEKWDDVGV